MSEFPDLCGGAGRATGRYQFTVLEASQHEGRALVALAATYRAHRVGCLVSLGGRTAKMARIEPAGLTLPISQAELLSIGPESDRLLVALADAWGVPLPSPSFRERVVLEHVVLPSSALGSAAGPPRIALFSPCTREDQYFELLLSMEPDKRRVEWIEKTPQYRKAVLNRLSAAPTNPS